mgnify:CR=1 FL=1
MSEKIREAFELWAISCHMCTYLDGVEYRHQSTEWAWRAWQASRAAMVVELPSFENGSIRGYSGDCDEANMVVDAVAESLDAAGVSYK